MDKHSRRYKERDLEKRSHKKERFDRREKRRSTSPSNSRSPERSSRKYQFKEPPNRHRRPVDSRPTKEDSQPDRKRRKENFRDRAIVSRKPVVIKQEPPSPENAAAAAENEANKEQPSFALSGKLAEDTNVYNGIVIKYNEPLEARKPRRRWRLYPFKGDSPLPMIPVHRQSAYLLGRERRVADIPIDHPSCSKQHAVLQFRMVDYEKDDGNIGRRVRPYVIDLESANGTFVNNQKIEARRYVELLEKDVIKFGFSSREYVVLHEESKDEILDDNVTDETEPE